MRRVFFFTGSGVATSAAASALSILTTLTLVAGGVVVADAIRTQQDDRVSALPVIGKPMGPIVVAAGDPAAGSELSMVPSLGSDSRTDARSGSSDDPHGVPHVVALVDVNRIKGTVTAALDAEEPRRMEEIGPIEQVERIIKKTQAHHTSDDEPEQPPEEEDRSSLKSLVTAGDEVAGTEVP